MKKIILISTMLVMMVFLINSVYALQAGYGSSANIEVKAPLTDSDGGKNYPQQGTCDGNTDYCVDTYVLREYYISGDVCTYTDYDCRNLGTGYTCQNGACVSPGSISATVEDSTGKALSEATVTCDTTYSCTTNANGQCTISNIPPGTYICTASKSGYSSPSQTVNVVAGETSYVSFTGGNALKENCKLNSVSISATCTECVEEDEIEMSASISGDCSDVDYLQIDAQDTDSTCKIEYSGGDMQGITSEVSVLSSATSISSSWTIPNIPNNCLGKTVSATAGGLYTGGPPGTGTNVGYTEDASGSFTFEFHTYGPEEPDPLVKETSANESGTYTDESLDSTTIREYYISDDQIVSRDYDCSDLGPDYVSINGICAQVREMQLLPGFNLVSFPYTSTSLAYDRTDCPEDSFNFYNWNTAQEAWEISEKPQSVTGTKAYWIYTDTACTLYYSVGETEVTPSDVRLAPGWNEIGIGNTVVSFQNVKGNCAGKVTDGPLRWKTAENDWESATSFEPLKGYWIKVSDSCQFSG